MTDPVWPRVPVSSVCSHVIDCVNKTAPVVPGPTPYRMIRTTNVRNGFVDLTQVRYVEEDVYRKWTRRQIPKRGDVILTREAPLGEVGIIRDDDGIFLGQRLMSYRVDPRCYDSRFLLYVLLGPDLQAQIRALGSGSTVEHMRVPDAEKLLVPLPPLDTQRRIAGILSAYDDLIENNERRIAILEEMARRIFREWFVDFRFPGHEAVRMVDTEAGKIPEGWELKRLGDLAQDVRDSVQPDQVPEDTPYVGLEHIPRRSTTLVEWGKAADATSMKLRFRRGDVLFGKIRPYFHKVAVAPCDGVCSTDAIVLRATAPDVLGMVICASSSDEFVAHAVQTSNGTKMPRASWSVLAGWNVAVPPPSLRLRFNEIILGGVELANALVASSLRLRSSRDILLPRLISGDLTVSAAERDLETAA